MIGSKILLPKGISSAMQTMCSCPSSSANSQWSLHT